MEPSDAVLRGLLAAAPDALLAVDDGGRIVFVSDQAELLFLWKRVDLIGSGVECLIPERFRDGHPALRANYIRHPTARPMGADLDLWALRGDGTEFPAEISLSALIGDDGTLTTLAAVRDVTDRVELEAERSRQALAAQREQSHRLESVGQLAGGVAHDFNNLLGVILNYATLLTRRFANDEGAAADLGQIVAAAERAAALTKQLLAFARRDSAEPLPIDVNRVIGQFAPLLERTLGDHVEVRLELAPGPTVVLADTHQLEQVLLNLALNARDAMPDGGILTVSTTRTGADASGGLQADQLRLEVSDTGIGMDDDVMARAFEPFFTTKPLGEGTGLGLATVFGLVHQNGGEVTIRSALSVGTKVTVEFPLVDDVDVGSPPERLGVAGGGHERILLVEDEPALRLATVRILTDHGYRVISATDGVEALETLGQADAFDLILTDLAMPRLRGDALAAEILRRHPGMPIVFTSGYDAGGVALSGRLLEKPVAEEALLLAIREAIDG